MLKVSVGCSEGDSVIVSIVPDSVLDKDRESVGIRDSVGEDAIVAEELPVRVFDSEKVRLRLRVKDSDKLGVWGSVRVSERGTDNVRVEVPVRGNDAVGVRVTESVRISDSVDDRVAELVIEKEALREFVKDSEVDSVNVSVPEAVTDCESVRGNVRLVLSVNDAELVDEAVMVSVMVSVEDAEIECEASDKVAVFADCESERVTEVLLEGDELREIDSVNEMD